MQSYCSKYVCVCVCMCILSILADIQVTPLPHKRDKFQNGFEKSEKKNMTSKTRGHFADLSTPFDKSLCLRMKKNTKIIFTSFPKPCCYLSTYPRHTSHPFRQRLYRDTDPTTMGRPEDAAYLHSTPALLVWLNYVCLRSGCLTWFYISRVRV